MFRCVALHHSDDKDPRHIGRDTQHFLHRFREGVGNQNVSGMTLDNRGDAERIFEINIQVYSLVPKERAESEESEEVEESEEEEEAQLPARQQVRAELTFPLRCT